jgi:hypothetical protein
VKRLRLLDAMNMLVIAAVDHLAAKDLHFMPKIRVELLEEPDSNIQLRLTTYCKL